MWISAEEDPFELFLNCEKMLLQMLKAIKTYWSVIQDDAVSGKSVNRWSIMISSY